MNTTIACIFPETIPDAQYLFPLLQVFSRVVYLQAVENEPLETDSVFVRQCLAQTQLAPFSPVPLGEQRQRFMALVEDIRRHGTDYMHQLSMLTLAGLNRDDQQETTHSLMADLLRRTDIKEKKEENLLLWQSRLLLKLGEWHDQQQTEIDTALHHITARQDALLQALREEDEDTPFVLFTKGAEDSGETEILLRRRLKAWCRLCLHNQGQPPGIPVTRHAPVMELLQEMFEKHHQANTSTLAHLELPLTTTDTIQAPPLIEQFPDLQQAIGALAAPLSLDQATSIKQIMTNTRAAWQHALETRYPADVVDHCRLAFVYFPGTRKSQLLLEGCTRGTRSESDKKNVSETGCCIALLQKQ